MRNIPRKFATFLGLSLLVSPLCLLSQRANAQAMPAQDQRAVQDNRYAQDDDATRQQLADFDRFLDSHPEIAEQVRKDPSLLDNRAFVNAHPTLQTYLQDHQGIRDEVRQNPDAFMHQEDRFDRTEDVRDRDAMRREFDQFLGTHQEIAEQVRRDPSLLDNRDFVDRHPELQSYLQQRPEMRDAIRQDPGSFVRSDRPDQSYGNRNDRDRVASFSKFLNDHQDIRRDVSTNPALCNDRGYVESHPEFRDYLTANPDVRQNLDANAGDFVKQAQDFNPTTNMTKPGAMPAQPAQPSTQSPNPKTKQ
jgi:hypothetical protein